MLGLLTIGMQLMGEVGELFVIQQRGAWVVCFGTQGIAHALFAAEDRQQMGRRHPLALTQGGDVTPEGAQWAMRCKSSTHSSSVAI